MEVSTRHKNKKHLTAIRRMTKLFKEIIPRKGSK
uniref:Uncharacterized protein n=1 Tax=Siphoviridae sp. cttnq1 TaxID=2826495 RepID=A0A8S5R047_9CAUD|nr:MAG TPA: hypothetical protein [Siphoviridae sp. cttnq1]